MSKRCPECSAVYPDDSKFCSQDGNALVDDADGEPSRAAPGSGTTLRKAVRVKDVSVDDIAGSLESTVLDTRYKILRKLGEGGMAFVYEAQELNSGESVALKVISPKLNKDPTLLARLRREAGLAIRMEHPNVCRILRLGETEEGLIYLVMPYLQGELLSEREHKVGPMSMEEALPFLVQICSGLDQAHQLNIVHRDLKPENIMIVSDGDGGEKAMVMDFGLAKETRAEGAAKLTASGIILGTPEFMSPEQIRGKPLDARSDIYGLGVLAFEMFTGKLPFGGNTAQELMLARLRGKPVPLREYRRDLPEGLERVLAKMMETDREKRYSSTLELGFDVIKTADPSLQPKLREML